MDVNGKGCYERTLVSLLNLCLLINVDFEAKLQNISCVQLLLTFLSVLQTTDKSRKFRPTLAYHIFASTGGIINASDKFLDKSYFFVKVLCFHL